MKKLFSSFSVLATIVFFVACKKTDINAGGNTLTQPEPTVTGKPVGPVESKSIGAGGGTISWGNGKAEIMIPAGALSSTTNISIQPITNESPLGYSNAYRLKPEGLQFAKPVTLKLKYTANEMQDYGSAPALIRIAYQDTGNIWQAIGGLTTDTTGKTITASITHFSDWGFFSLAAINSEQAIVKPGTSTKIEVLAQPGIKLFDSLTAIGKIGLSKATTSANATYWKFRMHDIDGGGGVSPGTVTTQGSTITYTAPSTIPPQNVLQFTVNFKNQNTSLQLSYALPIGATIKCTVDGKSVSIIDGRTDQVVSTSFSNTYTNTTSIGGSSVAGQEAISINLGGIGATTYSGQAIVVSITINNSSYTDEYSKCGLSQRAGAAVTITGGFQNTISGYIDGQLAIVDPLQTENCNGIVLPKYRLVEVKGYFKTDWAIN